MEYTIAQAWALLDNIDISHEAWELDQGGEGGVEVDYDCIKSFSNTGKVEEPCGDFYLDSDIVLWIIKTYTKHLHVPKEKREQYKEPPKEDTLVSIINHSSKMLCEGKSTYVPPLPYPQRRIPHMVERKNLEKKSKK